MTINKEYIENQWKNKCWHSDKVPARNSYEGYFKRCEQERERFCSRYNPSIVSQLSGVNLLKTVFFQKRGDSLANEMQSAKTKHWTNIGNGSQFPWNLYFGYSKKTGDNKWIFCPGGSQTSIRALSESEAAEQGAILWNKLFSICQQIEKNKDNPNNIDYRKIGEDFHDAFPQKNGDPNKRWLKYLCLNYPNIVLPVYDIGKIKSRLNKLGYNEEELKSKTPFEIIGEFAKQAYQSQSAPACFEKFMWDFTFSREPLKADLEQPSNPTESIKSEVGKPVTKKGELVLAKFKEESSLNNNHDVIFYGVPGCGKSYYISNMLLDEADQKKNGKDCSNVFRVTFYPEYSYTDFVGQIQPSLKEGKLVYEFVPGPFTKALQFALGHPDSDTFLIIEEINRGNAAAIFGDLFQLLDRDQDGNSEYPITNLEIAKQVGSENGKILLPKNLYLFATRNTSDQNVSALDTAFKRRWEWQHIENKPADEFKEKYLPEIRKDGNLVSWNSFVDARNKKICEANSGNGSDKQLGYYFVRECDLISENEKDMDAEAKKARFFWEKVFRYLWNDAFAVDHAKGFNKDRHSLSNVLDLLTGKPVDIKDILSENIEIG